MPAMRPRESFELVKNAVRLWLDRNAFQHAGALSFCTLFSLAPLLILLITIVGIVYGGQAASGEISARIADLVGAQVAAAVAQYASTRRAGAAIPGTPRRRDHSA